MVYATDTKIRRMKTVNHCMIYDMKATLNGNIEKMQSP